MCRLVAYLGLPLTLQALLYDPPHSLVRRSWEPRHQRHGEVNADGFGVGWYDHAVRPEPAGGRPTGPRLRRLVSDTRAAGIEGASDSEVLFALGLDRLDTGLPPGPVLAEVVSTVAEVAPGRLNLVLTDGHRLAATACGDSPFALEGDGSLLVASEPHDDDARWQPVPEGSLLLGDHRGATVRPITEKRPVLP